MSPLKLPDPGNPAPDDHSPSNPASQLPLASPLHPYNPFLPFQITKTAKLQRKHVDDVLGGDDAWKNVAKTEGE